MHLLLPQVLVVVLLLVSSELLLSLLRKLLLLLLLELLNARSGLLGSLLGDPLRLLYPLRHLGLRPKLLLLLECPSLLFPECEKL